MKLPVVGIQYETYHCKVHKKIIYYFKSDNHITGFYHCWDCVREKNQGHKK